MHHLTSLSPSIRIALFLLCFSLVGSSYSATYFSQGTGLYSTLANWNTQANGSGTIPPSVDLTSGTHNFVIQNGHVVTIDMNPSTAALTIDGSLIIGDNNIGRTVSINGVTTIGATGQFVCGTNDATHPVTFRGSIINAGTLNFYNNVNSVANSTFIGSSLTASGAGLYQLNHLTLTGSPTTSLTLNSSFTIKGQVVLNNACTLNDGGLTHYVEGNWNEQGSGQLTGLGTIEFNSVNSIQLIETASVFNNLRLNLSGGLAIFQAPVTVNGDFSLQNFSNLLANTHNHILNGNLSIDGTSTLNSTGTLTFSASGRTQIIPYTSNCTYQNLTFSNGGATFPKTIDGNLELNGQFTINSTAQVNATGDLIFRSSFRQDGICNFTGSITFLGAGANIQTNTASPNLGSVLIVSNLNAGATLTFGFVAPATSTNWPINNDLIINSGNLVVSASTNLTGQSGYNFKVLNNAALYIRGTNNFPTGFGAVTIDPTTSAFYDVGNQVVKGGIAYGTLNLTAGTKTMDGSVVVRGNLNLATNVVVNFLGFDLDVEGNLNNPAGCALTNDQTVRLNAPDANQTVTGTGTFTFQNLVCSSNSTTAPRTKTFSNNMVVNGDFTISNNGGTNINTLFIDLQAFVVTNNNTGTFSLGDYTILNTNGANSFRSMVLTFGTRTLSPFSTVRYSLALGTNSVQFISNDVVYGSIDLVGSGFNSYKSACGNLTLLGNFTRSSGNAVFRDSSFSFFVGGNYTLNTTAYPNPSSSTIITFNGDFQSIGFGSSDVSLPNVVFAGTGIKQFAANSGNTVFAYGDFTISNGVTVDANDKNLSLRGNFINNGTGLFTQTATTTFNNANLPQTVITNSGSFFGNININKPALGAANRVVNFSSETNIGGTLTLFNSAAQLEASGVTINIGGSWTINPGCAFNGTNGTVNFNGTGGTQTINNAFPLTYHHLRFSNSATKSLVGSTITVNGDLTISSGVFQGNTTAINANGNWTNNGSFTHSATVTLSGLTQTISGNNSYFFNLICAGTGTKTITNSTIIAGSFTINSGVIFDVTNANIPLSIGGNYTNNGTINLYNATVFFTGGAKNIITGGTGAGKRFYNVEFNAPASNQQLVTNDMEVLNDFVVNAGTFSTGVLNLSVAGNLIVNDIFNAGGGTLNLVATSGSKSFKPGITGSSYRAIVVNAPGATYTLTGNDLSIVANANLSINAGTLSMGGRAITMSNGNVNVNPGGTFHINAGAQLLLANGASLNNAGGTLMLLGTPTTNAFVRRNGTSGGFTINQTAGTLQARYYVIENSAGAGFTISGTSVIHSVNNLSNGIFTGGTGTQYLMLSGYDFTNFTVNNVQFNAGSPSFNVSRQTGNGVITFNGSTGIFAGTSFERDNGNRIEWTSAAKRWNGSAGDNNWHTAANWTPAFVPTVGDTVYLDHTHIAGPTPYTVNITTGDAAAGRLVIDRQTGTGAITLNIGANRTLDVSENVNVLTGCTLTQTNATSLLNVGGSFVVSGTFNNGSSTVNFNANFGYSTISPGTASFFNLTVSGASTYVMGSSFTVSNNLILNNGVFDVSTSSYNLTVQGDFAANNPAIFLPRNCTVTFSRAGNQNISGGPFNNFVTQGSGTKFITSNVNIANVTIGSGTVLNAGNNVLFISSNWTNNANLSAFSQTATGLVQFNSTTGTQLIDNGTSGTTYSNLLLVGAAAKTISNNLSVNGDFTIGASCGNVDLQTFQVTGTPSKVFSIAASNTLIIRGTSNFPSNFGTVSISGTNTVLYTCASTTTQNIFSTTYGNLNLQVTSGGNTPKNLTGDITVLGSLVISDTRTQLVATNRTINLSGDLSFPSGGNPIQWGTSGTLVHNGNWNIDVDYSFNNPATPEFRNLTLSGITTKNMLARLNISGNVQIQNNVTFNMGTFTLTGAGGNFTMQDGSTLNSAIPAATGVAFPTGFGIYALNQNSNVNLNGGANNQTIFNTPVYGNLTLSNTATSTIQAGADLLIAGNFNTNTSTLNDNSRNITCSGTNIDLRLYTPSSTSILTLNGANQNLYDASSAALDIRNIVFANTGTKSISANFGNIININGDFTNAAGVIVSLVNRTINFSGSNWVNNGTYNHLNTAGVNNGFNFTGSNNQTVNLGVSNTIQHDVTFSKTAGSVTFVSNGGNFTRNNGTIATFIVNAGNTVNMGALTHRIDGSTSINGTFNCTNTNFNFSGGNQNLNIAVPFIANNVVISGTGTKTMGSDWTVNNLTINGGNALNTNGTSNFNITCNGNWINNGTFTVNTSTVFFESINNNSCSITAGNSPFRDVIFNNSNTNTRTYSLISPSTTFARQLTMNTGVTLSLNGNVLILGSNNSFIETHTVHSGARLLVNSNSLLSFNNDNGTSTLNVGGTLEMIGNNVFPARVGRSSGNGRHQINMLSGSLLKAQYYSFEYLSDAGLNVAVGATVDPTNNLSDGTWSFINTAGGTPKYYLSLDGTVTTPIQNVFFNFVGTPTAGVHFNIRRTTGTTVQLNEVVSGSLGTFQFESDIVASSATTGLIRWPVNATLTWNGTTSNDWHTAANWTPAQVPTAFDNVIVPAALNDPRVSTANAVCKNINITNGFLSIQNGFKLIVSNDLSNAGILGITSATSSIDIGGNWTNTNVFSAGSGTVNFTGVSGYFQVSPGLSAFNNVNLTGSNSIFAFSGTTITFNGNITIGNATLFPNNSGYTYFVKGNFTNNGAFSNLVSGTVNFNGINAQSIVNGAFNGLTISGSNTKTTTGPCQVLGTLTLSSGATFAASLGSIWDLRGTVNMQAGSAYKDGGNQHTYTGTSWTGLGDCLADTGGIRFILNGTQTIFGGKFNDLSFEIGGSKVLSGNVIVNGDVLVATGTAFLNMQTFTLDCINPSAVFTLASGTNLYIRGSNNTPTNFGTYDLHITSNTYFDAALNQIIGGITYGNLILNNPFTKTLGENTNVRGNLTFNNATLDCSTNNYILQVGGIYNNNSTGSFIANQGEVIFNGTSGTIQYVYNGGSGTKAFYNLTIDRPTGFVLQLNNGNPSVLNDLTVQGGTLDINGNTINVRNNIEVTTGTIQTSGLFTMTANDGAATIRTNGSTLNNFTINALGATVTAIDNFNVNASFNLLAGTFNGNGMIINLGTGNQAANIYGTYIVGAGGRMGLGNGVTCTVFPAATFQAVGTPSNYAIITNNTSGGRYNFVVNGNIAAQHYLFENMSAAGIQITASATIDAVNNFSNGTFTNGITNGVYLVINNAQTLTMENVSFPLNSGGSSKNVAKTADTGNLTFNNFQGGFGGATFENDPFGRIAWTGTITLIWSGYVNTDWFNLDNWTASAGAPLVPTGAEDVLIPIAINQPLINQDGAITGRLTINNGATLTLNTPFASAPDLTILGDLILNGVLASTGAEDTLNIKGNWNRGTTGNFVAGNSMVIFNGTAGSKTITGSTSSFNNLSIDAPLTHQLGSNIFINKNIEIKQGTLDVTSNNFTMTVAGNWTNSATFTPRGGTVNLTCNGATASIDNGASRFFSLNINGASSTVFSVVGNDLRTSGNTTVNSGTLFLNNRTFFNGDNIGTDGLTVFGTFDMGNNGTLLNGTSAAITINSGGTFKAVGTSNAVINNIGPQATGFYTFVVNSGATLQANYYRFSNLNAAGLQIRPNATIHPVHNLSDGVFVNGAIGGTYLDIQNNFTDFTIDSVSFGSGPTYNVSRVVGSGVLTFLDASGARSGALFENDDLSATSGRVQWTFTNPALTWNGSNSTEWADPLNWSTSLGGPSSNPPQNINAVIIPNVSGGSGNNPLIKTSSGAATCSNMEIYAGGVLNIQENQSLTISGSITNQGSIVVSPTSSSTIQVSNLWSNLGTFTPGASTVSLIASSGNKDITTNNQAFNNLSLDGTAVFRTVDNLNVNNNFSINAGTFTVTNAAHQLNIGGNWLNNGTYNHGNGTVLFNKVQGTQTISGSTAQTFFRFNGSNTGVVNKIIQLNCNINILNNLTILTARTGINTGSNTIDIKGNWSSTGIAMAGTGTVIFSGTNVQTIDRTSGETMNHVTISNPAGVSLINNLNVAGNLSFTGAANQINLNARTLTLSGTATNISVANAARTITGVAGCALSITTGAKTVTATAGGSLIIATNVPVNLSQAINFGAGLTTINGTLNMQAGASVTSNAPSYGASSTLIYSSNGPVSRGLEWSATSGAGYPANITINTTASNTNLDLSAGGSALRQCSGNLTINNASLLRMNNMSHALSVRGNLVVNAGGTLVLSSLVNGNLMVGGNITINGSLVNNNREVICNGTTLQTLSGIATLPFLTINNAAGARILQNLTISQRLSLTAGAFNLNGSNLILSNNAGIVRDASGASISAAPTVNPGDRYDVSYNASMSPGIEWNSTLSPIRDVTVSGAGTVLTLNADRTINRSLNLLSGASLNLNGNSLSMINNSAGTFTGTIFVDGNSTISNSAGLGAGGLQITNNEFGANPTFWTKNVTNNAGVGTLTIASNVTMTISDGLFDFGVFAGTPITTMQGVFQVDAGASVATNPCIYASGSTLRFFNGNQFQVNSVNATWASGSISSGLPGIPWNVEINGTGTQVNLNDPRAIRNDITINGGILALLYSANSPVFSIGGNWTRTGAASQFFNPNGKQVSFAKSTAGNQTITASSGITSESFYDMDVNHTGGGNLVVGCDLQISNNLNLSSGKMVMNTGKILTIGAPGANGTITGFGPTRYIITWDGTTASNIIQYSNTNTTYHFPLGDNTNYTPMFLQITSGATAGSLVTGAMIPNAHPQLGTASNYIKRYWSMEQSGLLPGFTYNTEYIYVDADVVGSESLVFPFKYTPGAGVGTGWIGAGGSSASFTMGTGSINPATNTLHWDGVYSFSDLTGSGGGTPLPVSLVDFEVYKTGKAVKIQWATLSETNNDYFTVERSMDLSQVETIATIKGAGNHNGRLAYEVFDENPLSGTNYYRLKQTDFDGKTEYTQWKAISFETDHAPAVKVYPNPSSDGQVFISAGGFSDQTSLYFTITDIAGKLHAEGQLIAGEKAVSTPLSIQQLSPGMYVVQVRGENTLIREQLIVK
ncbi:MAG: T9SS type A sorting domain-containing protein [Bacteroidota bacterium]